MLPDETLNFHAWLSHKENSVDNTHLNMYGAALVAYDVISAVKNSSCPLAAFVLDEIQAPNEKILVKNKHYARPPR